MRLDCEGCEYELQEAYFYVQEYGYYVATSIDYPMSCELGENENHYSLLMVNDDGEVVLF